jgi:hypothetical protein
MTILLSMGACKKKEEEVTRTPLSEGPIMDTPDLSPHMGTEQKIEFDVVVPPDVESEWSAVNIEVEDKELNKTQEFTVQIGDELKIPESDLTVKVLYYLPDFKMSGPIITSASNKPGNPAVGLSISEGDTQLFPESDGCMKNFQTYTRFNTSDSHSV